MEVPYAFLFFPSLLSKFLLYFYLKLISSIPLEVPSAVYLRIASHGKSLSNFFKNYLDFFFGISIETLRGICSEICFTLFFCLGRLYPEGAFISKCYKYFRNYFHNYISILSSMLFVILMEIHKFPIEIA